MAWDYMDGDSDSMDLPAEAGNQEESPFNPDDNWIKGAPRELQIEAMRRWFLSRFADPAEETPYCGAEGGYQFIHGGPYDPNDVIQERFSHVVEYEVMEELISNLYRDVGDEWAPIYWEIDYDDELLMFIVSREDPIRMFSDRLSDVIAVLDVSGSHKAQALAVQLAFGAAITALEAYLWDTATYWTENSQDVFKRFVSTNVEFGKERINLSEIFSHAAKLKERMSNYLRDFIWHRLDKVKPMFEQGFEISVSDISDLMQRVLIRHDIAHRGGRDKDGNAVIVSPDDVHDLVRLIRSFAESIESQLANAYPESRQSDLDF